MALYGALDLSGSLAAFAVMDDAGQILIDESRPMRGREAASLAVFLTDLLAGKGLTVRDVTHWTVGSGPGSFTGMRLASALVKGWVFGCPEIKVRCVPSALIAASAADAETVAVLQDGRNQEMLVFGLKKQNGTYVPDGFTAVWNKEQAAEEMPRQHYSQWAVFAADKMAVERLLPEDSAVVLQISQTCSAVPLLRAAMPFDGDLDKLVYIRPAVFS
ncbi:MAG: hypothetical protein IKD46_04940 [Lentisphaeria bacterium]|nr:hypothetical protein [Lentisphaeria bacterium]